LTAATLVPELLCLIFSHSDDLQTLLNVPQVCSAWREASLEDTALWTDVNINAILDLSYSSSQGAADPKWATNERLAGSEGKEKALMCLVLERGKERALSITGDFLGTYIANSGFSFANTRFLPKVFRGAAALAIEKRPLSDIKSVLFIQHAYPTADAFVPTLKLQDPAPLTVRCTGKPTGCVWIHSTEYTHPTLSDQDLAPDMTDFEAVRKLKGWEEEDEEYNAVKQSFFVFRTMFSTATGKLRSSFSLSEGRLAALWLLELSLPGSSYRYLPMLAQMSGLKSLKLVFTSPPIFPTDDSSAPYPAAYPGDQTIRLPSLLRLAVQFLNGSFAYTSSWKFFDAFAAGSGKLDMSFHTDHFQMWPPQVTPEAYVPLYNFLKRSCGMANSFSSSVGPGMDVESLINSIGGRQENGRLHLDQLCLTSECWDPRQTLTPRESLSHVLDVISQRYVSIHELLLAYPLPNVSGSHGKADFEPLERFMHGLSAPDGFGFSAHRCKVQKMSMEVINSDVRMIKGNGAYPITIPSPGPLEVNLNEHLEAVTQPSIPKDFKGHIMRGSPVSVTFETPRFGRDGAQWGLSSVGGGEQMRCLKGTEWLCTNCDEASDNVFVSHYY